MLEKRHTLCDRCFDILHQIHCKKVYSSQTPFNNCITKTRLLLQINQFFQKRILPLSLHAFSCISNMRLRLAYFEKRISEKMRFGLRDNFKMIVLVPTKILNTFLSGRVRYLFRKFDFCLTTSEPGQKIAVLIKKACITIIERNMRL